MFVLFAQREAGNDAAASAGVMGLMCSCGVVPLIAIVVVFAIMWKVFTKAGQPGWAALVPFYNTWVLVVDICKKEPLWFVLSLIPFVNIVVAFVLSMELAKRFGKSEAFGVGLFFLSPIFLAILAFGDARYQGGGGEYDADGYEDDRPARGRGRPREEFDDDEDDYDRPRRGR